MLNYTTRLFAVGLLFPVFCSHAINLQQAVASAFQYDVAIQLSQKTTDADKQKYWQGVSGLLPQIGLEGNWNRQEQPEANYQNGVTSHNFSRQLSKLRNGLTHGQNTRTEVDEAQANFDIANARTIQAENDLLLAGEAFRHLTGLAPDTIEDIKLQCARKPVVANLAEALRQAQHSNVTVKIAQFQTRQADADVDAANSAHLPVVSAYASYGKNWSRSDSDNFLYDAIFGTESKSANLHYGVNVSIPLFSGGAQLS